MKKLEELIYNISKKFSPNQWEQVCRGITLYLRIRREHEKIIVELQNSNATLSGYKGLLIESYWLAIKVTKDLFIERMYLSEDDFNIIVEHIKKCEEEERPLH